MRPFLNNHFKVLASTSFKPIKNNITHTLKPHSLSFHSSRPIPEGYKLIGYHSTTKESGEELAQTGFNSRKPLHLLPHDDFKYGQCVLAIYGPQDTPLETYPDKSYDYYPRELQHEKYEYFVPMSHTESLCARIIKTSNDPTHFYRCDKNSWSDDICHE